MRKPTRAVIVISVAGFMAALDSLVVTTALPEIRQTFGASMQGLSWTVNAYTIPFAVLLMFGAALGDRFGRRRLLTLGLTVFSVSSAWAALSSSAGELIAARAVQGMGAAMITPVSLTLLSAAVPAERRGVAFGIRGAVCGLAIATGPLIGGTLTELFSWQWIFWVNVPIGLLLLPLVRHSLDESHGPNNRLDVIGTALISSGTLGLVYAVVNDDSGWTSVSTVTGLIAGPVLLAAFVWYERRAEYPMLPMRLFRNRAFSAVNGATLLMCFGMSGSIFLLSQLLQIVEGHSPLEAGVRMLPWTCVAIISAPLAGLLSDRIGERSMASIGLGLLPVGLASFALSISTGGSYSTQLPGMVISSIGMAMFSIPASALLMGSVGTAEEGIASGIHSAVREVGGALGIAVLGAVFSAYGGYPSRQAFVNGVTPALWTGCAAVALAALAALSIPRRRRVAVPGPGLGETDMRSTTFV